MSPYGSYQFDKMQQNILFCMLHFYTNLMVVCSSDHFSTVEIFVFLSMKAVPKWIVQRYTVHLQSFAFWSNLYFSFFMHILRYVHWKLFVLTVHWKQTHVSLQEKSSVFLQNSNPGFDLVDDLKTFMRTQVLLHIVFNLASDNKRRGSERNCQKMSIKLHLLVSSSRLVQFLERAVF